MTLKKLYKLVYILPLIVGLNSCITENEEKVMAIVSTNRIYPSLIPTVCDSEFTIVKSLFSKNNLSLSNLKIYRLLEHKGYHVRCYQYYSTFNFRYSLLELFRNDVVFNFDTNHNFYSLGGELINEVQINFRPKVTIAEASNLFYYELKNDWWYKDSVVAYSNDGFNAELGIYDLNAGFSYAEHNFVLAWRLTTNNGFKYPRAYIRADSLELINYSNGIIIN
jgi:hypothetical protein